MNQPLWNDRFRRRKLPHIESAGASYFVTFRLSGSLPAHVAAEWLREQSEQRTHSSVGSAESELQETERHRATLRKFDDQLERGGFGPQRLSDPQVAELTVGALKFFDGDRYVLPAYIVMPNHVHIVIVPLPQSGSTTHWGLDQIMHSVKSFTAHRANKLLGTDGAFWQREYYDHLIRDDEEFAWYLEYTLCNPVAAGLCARPEDWPWSNANSVYRDL